MPPLLFFFRYREDPQATRTSLVFSTAINFIHRKLEQSSAITMLRRLLPIRASIAAANGGGTNQKGMGMTEPQDNVAQEREEIMNRVANFKATQQRFERERDEFFVTTLGNARLSEIRHLPAGRPPFRP